MINLFISTLQTSDKVVMAVENLLHQVFNCDFTRLSTNEYHCNQQNKVITLRVNMITYYAKDRVEHFYSYLRTENVSLFDGAINISEDEAVSTLVTSSDTIIVYIIVVVVLFCGMIIFIITIVLVVKRFKKKSLK